MLIPPIVRLLESFDVAMLDTTGQAMPGVASNNAPPAAPSTPAAPGPAAAPPPAAEPPPVAEPTPAPPTPAIAKPSEEARAQPAAVPVAVAVAAVAVAAAKVAAKAISKSLSKTQKHHADPKFMGGKPNQPLTTMPTTQHQHLHKDLQSHLRSYVDKFGNTMSHSSANPGRAIRSNFTRQERLRALQDFYKANRRKYNDAANDFFSQHPGLK